MGNFTDLFPVLKKISTFFQGRIEKLKNELDALEKEETELLKKTSTIHTALRLIKVQVRMTEILNILKNNAKD